MDRCGCGHGSGQRRARGAWLSTLMLAIMMCTVVTAEQTASPSLVATEFHFPDPARLTGDVDLTQRSWALGWSPREGETRPPLDDIAFSGAEVSITEHRTPVCSGRAEDLDMSCVPVDDDDAVSRSIALRERPRITLLDFTVEITVTHPKNYFSLAAWTTKGDATLDPSVGPWNLTTEPRLVVDGPEEAHRFENGVNHDSDASTIVMTSRPGDTTVVVENATRAYMEGVHVRATGINAQTGERDEWESRTGHQESDEPLESDYKAYVTLRLDANTFAVTAPHHDLRLETTHLAATGMLDVPSATGTTFHEEGPEGFTQADMRYEGPMVLDAHLTEHADDPGRYPVPDTANALRVRASSGMHIMDEGVARGPEGPSPLLLLALATAGAGAVLYPTGLFGAITGRVAGRFDPETVMRSPVRRRIVELLKERPGLSMREASRSLGLGWGSISHHVAMLQATGRIEVRPMAGKKCLFLPDARRDGPLKAQRLLHDPKNRAILKSLLHDPEIAQKDLAAVVEMSPSQVSRRIRGMIGSGLLEPVPERRGATRLTESARQAFYETPEASRVAEAGVALA